MKSATAGQPSAEFEAPDGITFAEIDRDTGKLAVPGCPHTHQGIVPGGNGTDRYRELHRDLGPRTHPTGYNL